jgi:acid stress-induced BolA-like protein IbaG/YrbA
MASVKKTTSTTPGFVNRLRKGLAQRLGAVKVDAKVSIERIDGTDLFRVTVVAGKFARLRHSERQNLVWRICDDVIPDNKLHITMIQTLTPSELSSEAA